MSREGEPAHAELAAAAAVDDPTAPVGGDPDAVDAAVGEALVGHVGQRALVEWARETPWKRVDDEVVAASEERAGFAAVLYAAAAPGEADRRARAAAEFVERARTSARALAGRGADEDAVRERVTDLADDLPAGPEDAGETLRRVVDDGSYPGWVERVGDAAARTAERETER
jgi:hypothetical protein